MRAISLTRSPTCLNGRQGRSTSFFEPSFCAHIELSLAECRRVLCVLGFRLNDIHPEIAELLELLKARDQFDEM
jgi:hypothetical protein